MECPAQSTTSFRPPTIWRRGFMTTLSRHCCTRLTAADRIRRAASSPERWSARRLDLLEFRRAFLMALRTFLSLLSLLTRSETARKTKIQALRCEGETRNFSMPASAAQYQQSGLSVTRLQSPPNSLISYREASANPRSLVPSFS